MTLLVTIFLVLINIHNTIQTNSPKVSYRSSVNNTVITEEGHLKKTWREYHRMSYHLKTGIIQGQCHEKRVAFYPEVLLKAKWTANDFFLFYWSKSCDF